MAISSVEVEARWRYDVFLCFRGKDTRLTFAGNLCDALQRLRFKVFMDFNIMKGGDSIAPTLLQALYATRMSIVVLSKNFAFSTWRLDELMVIVELTMTCNHAVLSIFYDVDPSDVRRQQNSFGQAMVQHENRFGKDSDKVQRWRLSLSKIADFPGYHFSSQGHGPLFSGKDTRHSFTGFLYDALCERGFKITMNDDDQISQSIIEAVEKAKLSIIVFSENYAHSLSCLDELLMILECAKTKNQMVWPIFYKVEPSDLRHQRNSYGKAMTEHEIVLGKDSQKVDKWRLALLEVANLKGWHLKIGYEYEFKMASMYQVLAPMSS